jgi:2'-5' RNA ligase
VPIDAILVDREHWGAVRLFVAVAPPDPVVELLQQLPRPEDAALRWTTHEQWHITLRFLGGVDDPAPVAEALVRVPAALRASGVHEVRAELGPASAWFEGRRILQVPVAGLEPLAGAVADATGAWGTPSPAPFIGHLTLARVRGRGRGARSLAGSPLEASWAVDRIELMSSRLGPGGARYATEATVALDGL